MEIITYASLICSHYDLKFDSSLFNGLIVYLKTEENKTNNINQEYPTMIVVYGTDPPKCPHSILGFVVCPLHALYNVDGRALFVNFVMPK